MGSPTSETVGLVAGDEESFEVCYLVCHWLQSIVLSCSSLAENQLCYLVCHWMKINYANFVCHWLKINQVIM